MIVARIDGKPPCRASAQRLVHATAGASSLAGWLICRPCPVGGAALVRAGHADRCPSCGALAREPEPGELGAWEALP